MKMHNPRLCTRASRSAIRVEGWQRVLFTRPSLHCQNNWHHSWTISTSSMNIRYMKAVLEYLVESAILQMKRHSSIHVVPVMSVMQNSHETNNAIKATINDTRTNDFEQQRRIEKSWYQIAILGIYVIIHNQAILVPMTTCFSICFSLQTDPTYAVHVKDANKTQHPPCPLSLAKELYQKFICERLVSNILSCMKFSIVVDHMNWMKFSQRQRMLLFSKDDDLHSALWFLLLRGTQCFITMLRLAGPTAFFEELLINKDEWNKKNAESVFHHNFLL